jgi:hypothetical protein
MLVDVMMDMVIDIDPHEMEASPSYIVLDLSHHQYFEYLEALRTSYD